MKNSAIALSKWILNQYPYSTPVTHLKLQKLLFYCYGTLLADGREGMLGEELWFQPWEHGPVNLDVWHAFKEFGALPLNSLSSEACKYGEPAGSLLSAALVVYGLLSAWQLREESHLETPWQTAYEQKARYIDSSELREYFQRKFGRGAVYPPRHLLNGGTFTVDGIPLQPYYSLVELADSLAPANR